MGHDISHFVDWLGYAIGVIAGSLEISRFFKERRERPVISHLVERELRDSKGQYTERQIKELTALMTRLTEQIQVEVPRRARRAYLESRRDELRKSLESQCKEYESLTAAVGVTEGTQPLSEELQAVIEQEIRPTNEYQARLRYRLYTIVAVVGFLVVSPQPKQFVSDWIGTSSAISIFYLDGLPYIGGMVISMGIALLVSTNISRWKPSSPRRMVYICSIILLVFTQVAGIYAALIEVKNNNGQNILVTLTLVPFGIAYYLWTQMYRGLRLHKSQPGEPHTSARSSIGSALPDGASPNASTVNDA